MLEVSGFWMVLLVGCFGGVLAEAWRWYKIRESPNLPSYLKSPVYWIITSIMILGGGILSSFYGTECKRLPRTQHWSLNTTHNLSVSQHHTSSSS